MKNILLINGHQKHEMAKGELNKALMDIAESLFARNDYAVRTTVVDDGYEPAEEVKKFQWADVIIFYTPVYWMSLPYGFKKYIDEVYMQGYGVMFVDDGREQGGKYGSGGLLQGKKYMLVTTWNAPAEAFSDKDQFFEGKTPDEVLFPFHKAQEFIGLKPLPGFSCHDVIKNPQIESDLERYSAHLNAVFMLSKKPH